MLNTALILAGGRNLRYGKSKGLEKVRGIPLIEKLVNEIRDAGIDNIIISANDPEPFRFLGLSMIPDIFSDSGPLAGIHSAFSHTQVDEILVIACDFPALTSREFKKLMDEAKDVDAPVIFARTERDVHPLCSIFRRNIFNSLEKSIDEGRCGVRNFINSVDNHPVFFENPESFLNMNTPEDLKAWEAKNVI